MHGRKPQKKQERKIRWIIINGSFNDKMKKETVSKINRAEVMGQLHESIEVHLVPDIEKGEVLLDSRGTGSFQQEENQPNSE